MRLRHKYTYLWVGWVLSNLFITRQEMYDRNKRSPTLLL